MYIYKYIYLYIYIYNYNCIQIKKTNIIQRFDYCLFQENTVLNLKLLFIFLKMIKNKLLKSLHYFGQIVYCIFAITQN